MPVGSLRRSEPGSRVLVVDDEGRLRDMLMRSAAEMGFIDTTRRVRKRGQVGSSYRKAVRV